MACTGAASGGSRRHATFPGRGSQPALTSPRAASPATSASTPDVDPRTPNCTIVTTPAGRHDWQ